MKMGHSYIFLIIVAPPTEEPKCTKLEGITELPSTSLRKKLLCSYDRQAAPVTVPVNSTTDGRVQVKAMMIRYRVHYVRVGKFTVKHAYKLDSVFKKSSFFSENV